MSSSPPSRPVWFLLLDSDTGQPFKGTSADKVSVSSSADVIAQFRDAVHLKNSSILTGISSSQLLIFKDKAAFDKRNSAVDKEKEEPLDPTESLGLLGSKEDMLVVVVPYSSPNSTSESSSLTRGKEPTDILPLQSVQGVGAPVLFVETTISVYHLKLSQIEQEIKALKDSEEFKTLASKIAVWPVGPEPSNEEKEKWRQDLMKALDDLNRDKQNYVDLILSMNAAAHSVKKLHDKIRKGYKKDTAIKDERLLLSDVAITMWNRFGFPTTTHGNPTFGDFKRAAGFRDDADVRDYFRKKANGQQVKGDDDIIKESLTEKEWIWLIGLNHRVNPLLHDRLIANQDGSLRLVLEHDVYEDGVGMAESVIRTLYGPDKKIDIKDAASDSSTSPPL